MVIVGSLPKFNLSLHLGNWEFSTLGVIFCCNTPKTASVGP
jgi:hypothetical protein